MRKVLSYLLLFLSTCVPAHAIDASTNDEQKTLYAVGLSVAKSLAVFDLSAEELEMVKLGITDAVTGKKTAVELSSYNGKVQELARTRRLALGAKQALAGKEFLEKAAGEKGAIKTESGLVYFQVKEGKGVSPASNDTVKVHYRGTLIDGREFDSSYKRGKPIDFRLDGVIKCWTEGVQRMKVGGSAKLVCPPELAYGNSGVGEMILPGATLAFEVELLDVTKATTPPTPVVIPKAKIDQPPSQAKPAQGAAKDAGASTKPVNDEAKNPEQGKP